MLTQTEFSGRKEAEEELERQRKAESSGSGRTYIKPSADYTKGMVIHSPGEGDDGVCGFVHPVSFLRFN